MDSAIFQGATGNSPSLMGQTQHRARAVTGLCNRPAPIHSKSTPTICGPLSSMSNFLDLVLVAAHLRTAEQSHGLCGMRIDCENHQCVVLTGLSCVLLNFIDLSTE